MNEQTINAIQKALAPVAEKIGQGAQYGWEVVLKQQYVAATEGVATAIGGAVIIGFALWWAKKIWGTGYDNMASYMIGGMGLFLGGIALVGGIDQAITHFLNPAYYALDFFIHLGTPTS